MNKIFPMLLLCFVFLSSFAYAIYPDIQINVQSGKADDDSIKTTVGIENNAGTSGVLSFYENNQNLTNKAYHYYKVNDTPYGKDGTYSWISLSNPTSLDIGDDEVSGAIPIGFDFGFYGNTYDEVYVSSNGFITFNPNSPHGCCYGQQLPASTSPNNLIAGF